MGRVFLSAIVLIITHLIVGSISLSLGLVIAVILVAALSVTVILFTLLGACHTFERLGWLSPGWTDRKILRLKNWAKQKWSNLPTWYKTEKKRIIEMLIETLKGREQAADEVKIWRSAAVGIAVLFVILLVKHTLHLTIGWSIAIVAVGSVFVAFPVMYVMSRRSDQRSSFLGGKAEEEAVRLLPNQGKVNGELREALQYLVELHRRGMLRRLVEAPPPFEVSSEKTDSNEDLSAEDQQERAS